MSANNELLIQKYKDGYRVSDIDEMGGHFIQDKPVKTLEEAVRLANKYLEDNVVEYGLRIEL